MFVEKLRTNNFKILLMLIVLASLAIAGCTPEEVIKEVIVTQEVEVIKEVEVEKVVVETVIVEVEPEVEVPPIPDNAPMIAAVNANSHNQYDLGHGPNDWCARCHSPQNWNPEATLGKPPTCMTCKFPTDDELRIADGGNVWVTEEEWVGIKCETCHILDDMGKVNGENAWLNPVSGDYVAVNNSTELCEKCHVTTTGNAFGSGVTHKITLGGSAHLYYSGYTDDENPPPQFCADCHNPHTLAPVQCGDCHNMEMVDEHAGSFSQHKNISCMACHDASGLDVGPAKNEELGGLWVTQETTMGRGGPSTDDVVSHSPTHEVLCDKCHYEENPWELLVLTEDGEIPEPPEEEGDE